MNRADRHGLRMSVWLVLAALLVRAALPLGWMPVSTDNGPRIMLCSGNGAIELSAATQQLIDYAQAKSARDAGDPAHGHDGSQDAPRDPCAFGMALAKAFDLPVPPLAEIVVRQAVAPSILPAITARLVAARGLRPPARGPPIFA